MTYSKRHASRIWIALALLLPGHALAACQVSSQGMVFGEYDLFDSQALTGVGAIYVRCDLDTNYRIVLGTGNSSNYGERHLLDGSGNRLNYNLYSDVTRQLVWGDGSGGSGAVSGDATAEQDKVETVYGRIPARQNVPVGNYSDVIVITVEF